MATWPVSGDTDWNTKMKANIDVGHDADGTHKKSQMLTDMGWSPTSYVGGESITFPNGLIMKVGSESVAGTTTDDVTYGTPFPTEVKVTFVSLRAADLGANAPPSGRPKSGSETSILQVTNADSGVRTIHWMVIGR